MAALFLQIMAQLACHPVTVVSPVDKVHWDIHCIVHIALKAKVVIKDKGQAAAALVVYICPHVAAGAQVTALMGT